MSETPNSNPAYSRKCLFLIFSIALTALLVFQSKNYGFEPGHLGWVSSHVLAQTEKSTWENGFVGYALKEMDEEGKISKNYFDRYPVVFSVIARQFRHLFADKIKTQVFAGRTLMNIIFFMTLVFCFFTLRMMTDTNRALIVVFLVFSGSTLVFYKEMYHFDQPAVLGLSALYLALANHLLKRGSAFWLYGATALAVSLGRGYSAMFVIALWGMIEVIKTLRGEYSFSQLVRLPVFKAGFVGLAICISSLAYNIYTEAKINNVPYEMTSIVKSARGRTGLDQQAHIEALVTAKITFYKLWTRTRASLIPYSIKPTKPLSSNIAGTIYLSLLILALIYALVRYQKSFGQTFISKVKSLDSSTTFSILFLLSGAAWLVIMKRLFVFHEYTVMYMLFFNLALYTFVVRLIPDRFVRRGTVVALFLFVASLPLVSYRLDKIRPEVEPISDDFQRIRNTLNQDQSDLFIGVDGGRHALIEQRPYILGFYLPNHVLTPPSRSRYVLSRNRNYADKNLTPDNQKIFLFQVR